MHHAEEGNGHGKELVTKGNSRLIRTVAFSNPVIQCELIEGARDFPIEETATIVNLGYFPIMIKATPCQKIAAFSSEVLTGVAVTCQQAMLRIRIDRTANLEDVGNWPGWRHLSQIIPDLDVEPAFSRTALWRSEHDASGSLDLSRIDRVPGAFQMQEPPHYRIMTNLWFAPAGTECLIHDRHDFIEFHTQLHGIGRMQKFLSRNRETLYSDMSLTPGNSHKIYSSELDESGHFVYPWHQYYAETDCIWLAVEYHHRRDIQERS